ncbi:MAG TPA: DUF1206 domain-containing protein [Vicinamibacterales bacterium]
MDVPHPLHAAASAARPAGKWIEYLARWGFIANAVVYLIVGILAVRWGLGEGGRITDPRGALMEIRRSTGGQALLLALVPGFFSYTLWRVLAAIFDGDDDGNDAAGIASRIFAVIKAGAYAALGVMALKIGMDEPVSRGSSSAGISGMPAVAFVIGAGVLAFACYEMYRAWSSKLSDGLRLGELQGSTRRWVVGLSRFGIAARSVVIGTVGFLMLRAAMNGHATTPTTSTSIHTAAHAQPLVYLLLGAGLMAYAVYLAVLAKYRKVRTA